MLHMFLLSCSTISYTAGRLLMFCSTDVWCLGNADSSDEEAEELPSTQGFCDYITDPNSL